MKALLVDDDPDLVILASYALEQLGGFQVVTSPGGAEVVDLARRERPEVVLMDVLMPELDGPELLRRLRRDPELAELPVIFLTGKTGRAEHERLLGLGARGVITKPIDPLAFAGEVRRLCGR
jgi:CheY-like chemotaxis protein